MKNELITVSATELVSIYPTIRNNTNKKKLYQISFLRAFASIIVCLYHLICGNVKFFEKSNPVLHLFSYGYLGVQVFFIISGFIICYSLPANYQIKNFGSFFKKRLIRVEPPYLLSILLTIFVAYLAALITDNPVEIAWKDLIYHIGYLNNFITNIYINGVYWTLGIEFQFYIMIGLLFPFLNKSIYYLILIVFGLLALNYVHINNTSLIFQHTPLFCIGILMYFISCDNNYPKQILLCTLAITLLIALLNKPEYLYTSLFTISIISIPIKNNKLIGFLSKISYSLYLTHLPIGGRVINLFIRFVKTDNQRYLTVAAAFVISIAVAYLFYLIIEKPAIRWSKRMRYANAN